jgi:membrane-bound lytic murein transglycosylase F
VNPWIRASSIIALRRSLRWIGLGLAGATTLTLTTCSFPVTELERLQELGRLRVVSRNAATTYYLGPEGRPVGLDYELATRFADHLGLRLEFEALESLGELLPAVRSGRADIAAGHITVTPERARRVRFGPAYQFVSQYVVYRRGSRRPRRTADLQGGRLGVVADSSHAETLRRLARDNPQLQWEELELPSVEELFEAVADGELDFAVTDSTAYTLNRRYYPTVRKAFDLTRPAPIAWAFPHGDDYSIFGEAQLFFTRLLLSGELERLIDKYYAHTDTFDWVGTRTFLRHLDSRLPRFEALFRAAAAEIEMDWHLLAAISYQESHWDPNAVSPTLVRGLMMLTEATAAQLGVEDRTSPEESILGGARYLLQLKGRLPEHISEPDRTWMALAAYNVGLGHLEDARIITAMNGRDPDLWADVREHLPLLARKQWYTKVSRGYARGRQPVEYVRNIRSYYDILLWKFPDVPAEEPSQAPDAVEQVPIEEVPAPERIATGGGIAGAAATGEAAAEIPASGADAP